MENHKPQEIQNSIRNAIQVYHQYPTQSLTEHVKINWTGHFKKIWNRESIKNRIKKDKWNRRPSVTHTKNGKNPILKFKLTIPVIDKWLKTLRKQSYELMKERLYIKLI